MEMGSEDVQWNEVECNHWRDQGQHIYTIVKEKHCGHNNTQKMTSNTHQLIWSSEGHTCNIPISFPYIWLTFLTYTVELYLCYYQQQGNHCQGKSQGTEAVQGRIAWNPESS
jgi:hypothetical protein